MNTDIVKIAAGMLQQNFELMPATTGNESLDEIRALLIEKIDFLLDHDFEKLLSILYRIDVDEEKAKAMLIEKSGRQPAAVLADLIIERMMEKARTRINMKTTSAKDDTPA